MDPTTDHTDNDDIVALTRGQLRALAGVVEFARHHCGAGEDIIGALNYTGAFHHTPVAPLAELLSEHLILTPALDSQHNHLEAEEDETDEDEDEDDEDESDEEWGQASPSSTTSRREKLAIIAYLGFLLTLTYFLTYHLPIYGMPQPQYWGKTQAELVQMAVDTQLEYNRLDNDIDRRLDAKYKEQREVEELLERDPGNPDVLRHQFIVEAEIRALRQEWMDTCVPLKNKLEKLEARIRSTDVDEASLEDYVK